MIAPTLRRTAALGSAALLLAALSGCSLLGTAPEPEEDTAENDALAAKFVACLTEQGQTAKILDGGMVGLLLPDSAADDPGSFMTNSSDEGGAPSGMVAIMMDDDGQWMAATHADGFPDEGGMRDAWTACETEIPDFEQPQPDMEGATAASSEDQVEAALAFAACARENGYADFPDPSDQGAMNLPAGITEDGFRQLLEDCYDPDKPMGLMIDKETADTLDFDLMPVLDDFFQAHPEFGPGGGGQGGTAVAVPAQ